MDPRERPWKHAHESGEPVLLLVRHGQTAWNASRRFVGSSDIPLDAVGRAQAGRAARALRGPLAAVYSSPLSRALETARAVHPEPTRIAGLAELDQGELEGLDGPTAIARFPAFFAQWTKDPERVRTPGGEGLSDLAERASASIAKIASAHRGGVVVGVYTHQMVISTLTCIAKGEPFSAWRANRVGNTHATALAWTPDGPRVVVQRVDFGDGGLGA